MEKHIKDLCTDEVIKTAISKWGGNLDNLKLLGEVENFVYEYKDDKQNFIFRVTHSTHQTEESLLAELEWIKYLFDNNISVCQPIYSQNKNLLEIVDLEDSYFMACVFEKAKGKSFYGRYDLLTSYEFLNNLGLLVGKIHSVSKNYNPKHKRIEWFEDDLIVNSAIYLKSQKSVLLELEELIRFLKKFNNDIDYGLVHADIHSGNFYLDGNDINIFDFDDSCYHFLVYDIGIIIYSRVLDIESQIERDNITPKALEAFMKGYNQQNILSPDSLELIPKIFRLRELLLYAFLHKKWDFKNLNNKQKDFFDKLNHRVQNKIPLVNFSVSKP